MDFRKPFVYSFQSTPSVWRETHETDRRKAAERFQSTPSVWRETKICNGIWCGFIVISIHSLRMEGD